MSFDAQKTRLRALDDWFFTPQGRFVGEAIHKELSHLKDLIYGETLLQLGHCGDNIWLPELHFSHKWYATPYTSASSTLISSFSELPIDRNSVDCILLPLTLEAFEQPLNPIDEIDRILKPMGHLVIFGFNPFSLWGSFMRSKRYSCYGPLAGRSMSVFSLQHVFLHRGYEQCSLSNFYYIPPITNSRWIQRLAILNELGKMLTPCPAGFYCLVLQKHQEIHPDLVLDALADELLRRPAAAFHPACQGLSSKE